MLNPSASLAMSTSVLKALPGKLDIKRHSPSILYLLCIVYHGETKNTYMKKAVEYYSLPISCKVYWLRMDKVIFSHANELPKSFNHTLSI